MICVCFFYLCSVSDHILLIHYNIPVIYLFEYSLRLFIYTHCKCSYSSFCLFSLNSFIDWWKKMLADGQIKWNSNTFTLVKRKLSQSAWNLMVEREKENRIVKIIENNIDSISWSTNDKCNFDWKKSGIKMYF